jgi:hypothetical protein
MPAVGTAVAGFLGLAGTFAGTVVAAAVNVGISFGFSYLARALAPKQAGSAGAGGFHGKMQAGGAVPRSFIFGRYATAGSLVYANTWGSDGSTPNAYLVQVIALSDLPVKGLAGIIVDGSAVTFDPDASQSGKGYAIPEYSKDGKDNLWIRFHDGEQDAADSYLVDKFASDADRPWDANRKGLGVAYAVVTARANPSLFSGIPQLRFVLDGVALYDVRNDTTAGGDGDERWSDPSTWSEAPGNNAVVAYNLLRGIRYGSQWVYGLQTVQGAQLPLSSWAAAANECDVTVTNADDTTAKQYECGGEIQFSSEPGGEIEAVLTACNGRLAEVGGVYKMHVGAAGSSVLSFDDGDILSTEQQTFTPFPSLDQAVNGVTGTFISPDDGWVEKDLPPRYDSTFEAEDGGRRSLANVQYSRVTSSQQGQRLMLSALQEARRARKHGFAMPPSALVLEPLDFVSFTSARNGYFNKLFRVDRIDSGGNLDQAIYLTEVDPADYDYDPEVDELPLSSGSIAIVRPPAQAIRDWAVAGVTIPADNGRALAGLRLTWSIGDDDVDLDEVQFEVRLASDSSIVHRGSTPFVSAGAIDISQNIRGATNYQVRGRFASVSGRDFSWSDWLDATTPDIAVSQAEVDASFAALLNRFKAMQVDILDVRRDIELLAAGQNGSVSMLRETEGRINIGVGQRFDDSLASAELALSTARTVDGIVGEILGSVYAVSGSGEAETLFDFFSGAGPEGVANEIQFRARGTFQDVMSTAGLTIQAGVTELGGTSRIIADASSFIFRDPAGVQAPFDALTLTVGDDITPVAIVGGEVQPDLSDRRELYQTLATAGFELEFPLNARKGRKWTHLITQDDTGGHSVTIGDGYFNPAGGSVRTDAGYTTRIDGLIISADPPIAMLTGFQNAAFNIDPWAFEGHASVESRSFNPLSMGAEAGELVVALCYCANFAGSTIGSPPTSLPSVSLPSGWNYAYLVGGQFRSDPHHDGTGSWTGVMIYAMWRRLDGSEGSVAPMANYTPPGGGSSKYRSEIYRFSGGATPTVIQAQGAWSSNANTKTLSLSAEQSQLIVIAAAVGYRATGSAPGLSMTNSDNDYASSGTNPCMTHSGSYIQNTTHTDETITGGDVGDSNAMLAFALRN